MKDYYFTVKLSFDNIMPADSKEEAKEALKALFLEKYDIVIRDDEITEK